MLDPVGESRSPGVAPLPRGRSWLGAVAVTVTVVLGLLAGCTPSAPAVDPSGGNDLRVMTWNVQTAEHSPSEWVQTIAEWRPDVIGLQEICAGEADGLADLLRHDHGLAYQPVPGPIRPVPAEDGKPVNAELRRPCRDGAVVQYGLAVLSRLPVTTAATELFAPDNRDEQRGYQRLTLRAPSGVPLTVYNAHLGLAGVQDAQVHDLGAAARSGAGPTVVLGDLNVPFGRGRTLAPLSDHFAEVDPSGRLPTSVNRPDAPNLPADNKIDYIFYRDLGSPRPAEAPWVPSSDHRPLIGVLRPDDHGR